jgi:hypothetical protein
VQSVVLCVLGLQRIPLKILGACLEPCFEVNSGLAESGLQPYYGERDGQHMFAILQLKGLNSADLGFNMGVSLNFLLVLIVFAGSQFWALAVDTNIFQWFCGLTVFAIVEYKPPRPHPPAPQVVPHMFLFGLFGK